MAEKRLITVYASWVDAWRILPLLRSLSFVLKTML